MLSYWNETLENISKDKRNDTFNLVVNKIIYRVPLSYALGISPLITEKYLKDPTFHEFEISINKDKLNISNEEYIQTAIKKFIHGQNLSSDIFFEIGSHLRNKEMIQQWKKSNGLKKETVIKVIEANRKIYDNNINQEINNIKEELQYIGEHMEEMKEEIKELNDDEVIFIFKNNKTKIDNEETIWEIVKERIKGMSRKANQSQANNVDKRNFINKSLLIGSIQANFLKKESFKEYIEMIEEEDIEKERLILENIKRILLSNIDNLKLEGKEKEKATEKVNEKVIHINHTNGQNFNGIIKYLENKHGKNIHEEGIISISASSSDRNKPEQVINYDWNDHWFSNKSQNNWLEIDFKNRKVKINGYSIKTYDNQDSMNCHLKNWIIEGSKDRNKWIEIDKKENNYDLNGANFQHYFPISQTTDDFQYIRIRCIGINHSQDNAFVYYLDFTNIEFFGEIHNCDI